MNDQLIEAADAIRKQRHPDAVVAFAAGSLVRGEGTAFSDLDLVVVYASLEFAYRESFRFRELPVEAFVHDADTLHYFFLEVDRPSGIPALAQMVIEGIALPGPSSFSRSLKSLASSVIEQGPPPLTSDQDRTLRYRITDLVDDLRDPRSYEEAVATGGQLYAALADYHLRSQGLWSAKGKSISRVLQRADRELSARYSISFEALFRRGDPSLAIELARDLLQPRGGFLFDGYRMNAPRQWRT